MTLVLKSVVFAASPNPHVPVVSLTGLARKSLIEWDRGSDESLSKSLEGSVALWSSFWLVAVSDLKVTVCCVVSVCSSELFCILLSLFARGNLVLGVPQRPSDHRTAHSIFSGICAVNPRLPVPPRATRLLGRLKNLLTSPHWRWGKHHNLSLIGSSRPMLFLRRLDTTRQKLGQCGNNERLLI